MGPLDYDDDDANDKVFAVDGDGGNSTSIGRKTSSRQLTLQGHCHGYHGYHGDHYFHDNHDHDYHIIMISSYFDYIIMDIIS